MMDAILSLPIILGSAGFFMLLNQCISKFKSPSPVVESKKDWVWRNTSVSFCHSLITAVWSLLCFVHEPKMLQDMIVTKSLLSYSLLAFSTGYFISDTKDIISHNMFKQWELLLHHSVVLSAFTVALTTSRYIGYGVCSLLMEVNSVFLHSRRLLKLAGVRKSAVVTANGVALLVTYICFRLMTSAWMINWLHTNRHQIALFPFLVGTVGMIILCAMNIGLLIQLWKSDFKKKVETEKIS